MVLSCRVRVRVRIMVMIEVSLHQSLHSISGSFSFCKDDHWTQVVQLFWAFLVENGSFHILTNFTMILFHNLNYSLYICVWCTENTRVPFNRTWRGNNLLFKGLHVKRASPVSRANSLNEVLITATTDTQNVISKQHWLSLTVGRA